MEPKFQVETVHNEDAYHNMVTVHYMLHKKNPTWYLYLLGAVLALAVWFLAANGNYASLRAVGIGITTLAIIWLLVPFIDRFSAKQVCHRLKGTIIKGAKKNGFFGIPTRYRFYETEMDFADSQGSVTVPYSGVSDLVETDGYFLVFQRDGRCALARKTDFTLGKAEDFKAFLSAACGREMRFFEMPKSRYR